jgi:hypothetical protein
MTKRRQPHDWSAIIEAAYAIENDESHWLEGVLRSAQQLLDRGKGSYAITYDFAAGRGIELRHMASADLPEGNAPLPGILARCQHGTLEAATICGTASHLMGDDFEVLTGIDNFAHRGVRDTLGINVRDPTKFGCLIAGLLPTRSVLTKNETDRWKKITAHVAAGYRLQRERRASPGPFAHDAAAVLRADGKIEHAENDAKEKSARDLLREAVRDLEAARGRDFAGDLVEVRKGLVAAKWTVLEHIDVDGRRYYIARENAAIPDVSVLSLRASGIGSKAAKRDHFKTGQRAFVSETGSFLSFRDGD